MPLLAPRNRYDAPLWKRDPRLARQTNVAYLEPFAVFKTGSAAVANGGEALSWAGTGGRGWERRCGRAGWLTMPRTRRPSSYFRMHGRSWRLGLPVGSPDHVHNVASSLVGRMDFQGTASWLTMSQPHFHLLACLTH